MSNQISKARIKAIFLANGFKEKAQADGSTDLNTYVYDAALALLAADQGTQGKHTYLVGYSHPRGAGRSFETFDGTPKPEDIEALENRIEARNGISSVSITSISRIGNSNE